MTRWLAICIWQCFCCACCLPAAGEQLPRVAELDFRIVAPAIERHASDGWAETLAKAQLPDENGEPLPVILLSAGDFDSGILSQIDGMQEISPGHFEASRPIVVWDDATLSLEKVTIDLRRDRGAFILAFGDLSINQSRVRGIGRQNERASIYRPFVLVAGAGALVAAETHFYDLGFGGPTPYGGVAVINGRLFRPDTQTKISDVRAERVGTVSILQAERPKVERVHIRDASGTGMRIEGGFGAEVSEVQVDGTGKHGLRITRGATGVRVSEVDIRGVADVAVFLDQGSSHIGIEDLTIANAGVAGVLSTQVRCFSVSGADIAEANGPGVILDNVQGADLQDLDLKHNAGAGLLVRNQSEAAYVNLSDLVFDHNTRGIEGAGLGTVRATGLDLSRNFPRIVAGELGRSLHAVLDADSGPPVLISGTPDVEATQCQRRTQG